MRKQVAVRLRNVTTLYAEEEAVDKKKKKISVILSFGLFKKEIQLN